MRGVCRKHHATYGAYFIVVRLSRLDAYDLTLELGGDLDVTRIQPSEAARLPEPLNSSLLNASQTWGDEANQNQKILNCADGFGLIQFGFSTCVRSSLTPNAVASIFIAPSKAFTAAESTVGSSRPRSISPSSS